MNRIFLILIFVLFTATNAFAISPESTVAQIASVLKGSRDLSRLTEFYNWQANTSGEDSTLVSIKLKSNGKDLVDRFRKESKTAEEKANVIIVEQEYARKIQQFDERMSKAIFTSTTVSQDEFSAVVNVTRQIDAEVITQTINMKNVNGKWLLDNLSIFNTVVAPSASVFGPTIDPRLAIVKL